MTVRVSSGDAGGLAPWGGLAEVGLAERQAVFEVLRARACRVRKADTVAFEHDDDNAVIVVLSGFLSVSKSLQDGRRQMTDLLLSGDVLDPASGDGRVCALQIEAMGDATVSRLPPRLWRALLRDCPPLERLARRIDAAQRARMAERALRLGKGGARMRLAYALLELWIRLGAIGRTEGAAFHVPMTQQDLGDLAGLSSVHVCRTLGRLTEEGLIAVRDHMDVRILDADALAEVAEIDAALLAREITPFAPSAEARAVAVAAGELRPGA